MPLKKTNLSYHIERKNIHSKLTLAVGKLLFPTRLGRGKGWCRYEFHKPPRNNCNVATKKQPVRELSGNGFQL